MLPRAGHCVFSCCSSRQQASLQQNKLYTIKDKLRSVPKGTPSASRHSHYLILICRIGINTNNTKNIGVDCYKITVLSKYNGRQLRSYACATPALFKYLANGGTYINTAHDISNTSRKSYDMSLSSISHHSEGQG